MGALPREEAKRSGLAVGAVNVLLVNARGEVLLQRRPEDKENGGRWDKTVGGHVDEGETFDDGARCARRARSSSATPRRRGCTCAGDEAESGVSSPRPISPGTWSSAARPSSSTCATCGSCPGAGSGTSSTTWRATSAARTCRSRASGRPADEIAGLRYAAPAEVDGLLVRGELAPNMAFLWLTHARALLALVGDGA